MGNLKNKINTLPRKVVLFATLFLVVGLLAVTLTKTQEDVSLENLLTAYTVESRTYAMYRDSAQKAQAEGYPRLALLLRALCRSVNVLADNHSRAIVAAGGSPQTEPLSYKQGTTLENLAYIIREEKDKLQNLYPGFVQTARKERNKVALKSFNFSKSAAAGSLVLLEQAYGNLREWEEEERSFWVCTVCGNLVQNLAFDQCPICFNPLEKYVKID